MENDQAPAEGQKTLTYLKWLVTSLTVTMIAGCIVVVILLVSHFASMNRLQLPESIVLPDGERAQSVTFGAGWMAVVTESQNLLVFSRVTGSLLQTIPLQQN